MMNKELLTNQEHNKIIDQGIEIIIKYLLDKKPEQKERIEEIKKYLISLPRYQSKDKDNNAAFVVIGDEQYLMMSSSMFDEDNGFEMKTDKQILQTMIHELGHAVSYYNSGQKIYTRFEEGIADIISDMAYEQYFNSKDYKKTSYYESNAVIRTLALANEEIVFSYLLGDNKTKQNETSFHYVMNTTLGKEKSKQLLSSELYSYNINSLIDSEKELLKELIEDIVKSDISKIPSIYIVNNKIVQEAIIQELKNQNLFDPEQIKEKYPNITPDFYINYEVLLSENGKKYDYLINNFEKDEVLTNQYLDDIANDILRKANLDTITQIANTTTVAQQIYNTTLKTENSGKLLGKINIELISIESMLIIYYLVSKGVTPEELYNQKNNLIIQLGINTDNLDELFSETITKQYEVLKDKQPQEIIEIIKNSHQQNIKNTITLNYYSKKLKENNISIEEYKKVFKKLFKETTKDNPNYQFSLFDDYIKAITDYRVRHNDNIDYLFAMSIFNEVDNEANKYELPGPTSSKAYAAKIILEKQPDVNLLYKIIESQNLHIISSSLLNGALLKILTEKDKLSIDTIETIVKSYTSDNYVANMRPLMTKRSSNIYEHNKIITLLNNEAYQNLIDSYTNEDEKSKQIISSEEFKDFDFVKIHKENKNHHQKLIDYDLNLQDSNYYGTSNIKDELNKKFKALDTTFSTYTINKLKELTEQHANSEDYVKYINDKINNYINSMHNFHRPNSNEQESAIETKYGNITPIEYNSCNNFESVESCIKTIEYCKQGYFAEEQIKYLMYFIADKYSIQYDDAKLVEQLLISIEELLLMYPNINDKILESKIHRLYELLETKKDQEEMSL